MQLFIIFIVTLIILLTFSIYQLNKTSEGFLSDEQFIQEQEKYYNARDNALLPIDPAGEKFYNFDSGKPLGQQLEIVSPEKSATEYSNVDIQVQKCKSLTSCSQLDGTECGFCFSDNKFQYGDDSGPYADVCEKGWVRTGAECQEYRERAICAKVTNCKDMVGEASICAWCPVTNKAMPYTEQNGILVPKYPDKDKCDDPDLVSGGQLGLVKQSDCGEFAKDHPCVGPNENTGPHSNACLEHLWAKSGCSTKGTAAPQNHNASQNAWWNARSWGAVFADMKAWFADANSSDWNSAKSHHKGCYGTDPDPCDPKYNGPLECYQKKFLELGCTKEGKYYPTSKPSLSVNDFTAKAKVYKNLAHESSISFNERNEAYGLCYGGHLAAPPPPKVGDYVSYQFNSAKWGNDCKIYGYICSLSGSNAQVYWELVENNKGDSHVTRSAHLSDPTTMGKYLGLGCGVKIPYFPEVPQTIPMGSLSVEKACDENTTCPDMGCALECIAYIHYPSGSYSVAKSQVTEIISAVRNVIPSTQLATYSDVENLANVGKPVCACGWYEAAGGSLGCGYPSVPGTTGGCGGGHMGVVNCGSNGPSWASGKAGVYVRMTINPSSIGPLLKKAGVAGSVTQVFGKTSYIGTLLPVEQSSCNWTMTAKGTKYGGDMVRTYTGDCDNSFSFKCVPDSSQAGSCQKRYKLMNGVIEDKNGNIVGQTSCCNQDFTWVKSPTKS